MPVPQRVKFGVLQRVKFLWGVGVGRPARPKNTTEQARCLFHKE
ncbi:hypothetical protein QUB16_28240 [Microcoleus sp. D3_18a_C4]